MKKLQAVLVLAAVVLIAADDDAVKKEKAKLKGTWEVTAMEEEGKKPPLPEGAKVKLVFEADKLVFQFSIGDITDKKTATYTIDPSKKPATLDLVPEDGPEKGKMLPCIFIVDKDELKICAATKPGQDRPKEFATKEGSKSMMMTLKRDNK